METELSGITHRLNIGILWTVLVKRRFPLRVWLIYSILPHAVVRELSPEKTLMADAIKGWMKRQIFFWLIRISMSQSLPESSYSAIGTAEVPLNLC